MTKRTAAIALAGLLALAGCGGDDGGGGAQPDPRLLWTFPASAPIYYGSPALSPDHATVYFGTSCPRFGEWQSDQAFYAVQVADGTVRRTLLLGSREVRSSPAVAPDGRVAFLVQERDTTGVNVLHDLLYLVAPDSGVAWVRNVNHAPLGAEVGLSAPAIAADGTIYVAGDALYAWRPDGTLKWKAFDPAAEELRNSPVVGADGTVYFVYHNIPLTALDPADGHVLWACPLGVNDHCFASPAIGADGTIYVATNPGVVYAVSNAGAVLWTFDAAAAGYPCTMRSSPAVAADGSIYLGTNSGNPASVLLALTPAGALKWAFEPADLPSDVPPDHLDIYSSPAIGSDGTIYFGQEFGRVFALAPADGAHLWHSATAQGITWSSPAITAGGVLLVGDLSGTLYALQTDSRGLQAGSPWPRYRGGNGGSGRFGAARARSGG
ncbi:MAG: outer membrane protein assembly factor BamB family protein [Candidatus Krumholzibacteriia bacterium]